MKHAALVILLSGSSVLATPLARAQGFAVGFAAPTSVAGPPGAEVLYDATARLVSSGLPEEGGAAGWSVAVSVEGAAIVGASTAGTVGADAGDNPPGLRRGGFEHTELTRGEGNEGATSAVVLSFLDDVTLPAGGGLDILRLEIAAIVPAAGCALASLRFAEVLEGSGTLVRNRISYLGASVTPALRAGPTLVCAHLPARLALEADAPGTVSGAALSNVRYEAVVRLQSADLPDAEGVAGWSLALSARGGLIIGATTLGTAAALDSAVVPGRRRNSGFELTELTSGPGNEGAISAVALDFLTPVMLDASGTADLLRLEIEAQVPEQGCAEVSVDFRDGLRGAGFPVHNRASWAGLSTAPATTGATTSVCVAPAGGGQVPGDCNQDTRLDISDVVCIARYLFQGQPATLPCDAGARDPGPGDIRLEDFNGDARVDISDVVRVAGFLFQGDPPHPLGRRCIAIAGCPERCAP